MILRILINSPDVSTSRDMSVCIIQCNCSNSDVIDGFELETATDGFFRTEEYAAIEEEAVWPTDSGFVPLRVWICGIKPERLQSVCRFSNNRLLKEAYICCGTLRKIE